MLHRLLHKNRKARGFTLVEIMVAVIILSVGLMGMAMMTIMVIRGNRMAVRQTHATNLAQQLMERLKGVDWNDLGTDDFSSTGEVGVGQIDVIAYETDLNSTGDVSPNGDPPYIYNLALLVCDDASPDTSGGVTTVPNQDCDMSSLNAGTVVSLKLVCEGDLNPGEKKLKIMVSWLRYDGNCRTVSMETIAVSTL